MTLPVPSVARRRDPGPRSTRPPRELVALRRIAGGSSEVVCALTASQVALLREVLAHPGRSSKELIDDARERIRPDTSPGTLQRDLVDMARVGILLSRQPGYVANPEVMFKVRVRTTP
jgi:hypothetical protein